MKFVSMTAALALAVTLLAGCANGSMTPAATATPAPTAAVETPSPAPSAQPEATLTPEGEPTPAADPENAEDAVEPELAKIIGFASDTAGGSLKAAQVSAALLEYAAKHPGSGEATALSASNWFAGLDDKQKALVALNWPTIQSTAQRIIADPAGQKDLLADAGVMTDFASLDLTGAEEFFNGISKSLGGE